MTISRSLMLWSALAVIGAGGLGYVGLQRALGPVTPVSVATRADFVQSVVSSGHVEAPFRINIGTQITGTVADVPVSEGQTVKSGDLLIALDNREAKASVLQAEGFVAQAHARLRQLNELTLPSAAEALVQAKATLTTAQLAFNRAAKLAADGYGTRAMLEEATKTVSIARAQVRNAEFQVFTNSPAGSDYVTAETQLNQASAALEAARSRLSYTTIRASRDGTLISRSVERGNVVQPSNVLMVLSPAGDTQVVVQIDEKNLGLIALGQKALASADAYPADRFKSEVIFINPSIDLQRASVEVKLRVLQPPAYLRQDMTVSVDIEVARHPGALVVPATTLHDATGAKPWVMAVVDGHARRQPVTLGLVSAGKAEVLGGVREGDQLVAATLGIRDGARLRAQVPPAGPVP